MTATYNNMMFDTPLLAQWAAFFDLAEWHWSTNPASINDWKPDFLVSFQCGHSECDGSHKILVSVLPVNNLNEIKGHPALSHRYQVSVDGSSIADAGAVFGPSPDLTQWEMSHGSGGGIESVMNWTPNSDDLWRKARERITIFTIEQPTR